MQIEADARNFFALLLSGLLVSSKNIAWNDFDGKWKDEDIVDYQLQENLCGRVEGTLCGARTK